MGDAIQAIGKIRERYGTYVGTGSIGLISNGIGVFRICRSDSNLTGQLRIKRKINAVFNKRITPEERLSILQCEDRFRPWQSLDDKRFCVVCERTFNGRQVEIRARRGGRPTLHCPTEDCNSTPRHWVRPRQSVSLGQSLSGLVARTGLSKETAAH